MLLTTQGKPSACRILSIASINSLSSPLLEPGIPRPSRMASFACEKCASRAFAVFSVFALSR